MKCEELLALLSDYVDGDLDRESYQAFRDHLLDCHPCEVVVDNIRQTLTVYKSGRPVEVPDALKKHLRKALCDRWEVKFPSADR